MVETIYSIPGAPFLAILSDLHGQPWQEVVNSLQKMKPEIIAIAGGYLQRGMVGRMNHERHLDEADLASIRNVGVILLDNEFTILPGQEIVIGGLTSGYCMDIRKLRRSLQGNRKRYPDYQGYESDHQPDASWLSDFAAAPGYHILISHHPEYYPLVPENVRLILSGHTHGGQWRFFGRGIYAPDGILFRKVLRRRENPLNCRRIKGLWRNIINQEDKALFVQWVAGRGSLSDRRARTSREGSC